MMAIYRMQQTLDKGLGLFAARDIRQGEHIFHIDLRELKRYTFMPTFEASLRRMMAE